MPNAPSLSQVQAAFPHWSIRRLIGVGTFKATYKAEKDGLLEAIKLFYVPEFEDSDEGATARTNFLGRFSREIHLLGQCETPYLVKLGCIEPHEINIAGVSFIVYSEQLLTGVTVQELINAKQLPSEGEIRALLRCLIEAISELWEKHDCVHRDIKPENIVRVGADQFVLLDLGISFQVGGTRFTEQGASPRTPHYCAPEMLSVDYANQLDARTDLYCAGVTAFEFASGVHPLGPFNSGSVEGRILTQVPSRVEDKRSGLSEDLCDLINRLNRKKAPLRGNLHLVRQDLGITL
jgi:serine/threonine protein kinase